jgi:hypothetical protein
LYVPHERIKKITCMNAKLVCRDVWISYEGLGPFITTKRNK